MIEYREVLNRPKLGFSQVQVQNLLAFFQEEGMSVVPDPLTNIVMLDESDRPFLEVAKFCHAPLVTGNLEHYPNDPQVMGLADFCHRYLG